MLLALATIFSSAEAAPPAAPVNLRTEQLPNPLGIGKRNPRLSWQFSGSERGSSQLAYRVQAAADLASLHAGQPLLWDSGKVASDESVHVTYGGPPLQSMNTVWWRVKYWDRVGGESPWSEPARFETGLLNVSDWSAEWIRPIPAESESLEFPVSLLRTEIVVDKPVASARVYATALGLYEMEINGRRVGDEVLTPGWTPYDRRLLYQTYDVTSLLRPGANALGVSLGDGWYRGELIRNSRNVFGRERAALVQLHVRYTDGSSAVFGSNANWKSGVSPILFSGIYDGETYDARLEKTGWSEPGYDDRDWNGVRPLDHPKSILVAPESPPIRRIQEITPVAILRTPAGETVFDFGQNMVGWVRLRVRGPAGTKIVLRHSEMLDAQGNFYTESLRGAAQTVTYIMKGGSDEDFEPHFTFQGFRYVAVDGLPGEPALHDLTGIVIHSDLETAGHWESSNRWLNQLQSNIVWSQRGNFVGIPTDCPQRDERLGWTGDAQVFARTAAYNMNVAGFFTQWLHDLAADQRADGSVPWVVPDITSRGMDTLANAAAGWGDAAVIIPWTMYMFYGDKQLLTEQYASMKGWVDYVHTRTEGLIWKKGHQFGDWLAYAAPSDEARQYPGATTSLDFIGTAFFAH